MITYSADARRLRPDQLVGFFEGWPSRPSPETHLRLLLGSAHVSLALDGEGGRVVGFATCLTDGVLAASIPLLEVLPEHRGHGIGRELIRRLIDELSECYMLDLSCDEPLVPFYESLGFARGTAMLLRRREQQAGRSSPAAGSSR